jgi:hypothetical protein
VGDTLVFVGYAHFSLVEGLRPEIAYPDRKIRKGRQAVTTVTAAPCDCPDRHVEVWVSDDD